MEKLDELNAHDYSALAYTYGSSRLGSNEFWFELERKVLESVADGTLKSYSLGRALEGFGKAR